MRKTLLSTLALALMLAGGRLAGQDLKPVAIVSIASYNTLKSDLKFAGEAASADVRGLVSHWEAGKHAVHPVTALQTGNRFSGIFHNAHEFVTQGHGSGLWNTTGVYVQIGAADGSCRNF